MKTSLNNKYALIGLTLVVGILLGWLIKPSASEEETHDHTEAGVNEIWTCSMHPQIKLGEPGDCPICGMDLIPAGAASSTSSQYAHAQEMTAEAIAMSNIQTTRVSGGSTGGKLSLTGKIQADERQNASVTAKFPGRIERLYVSFTGEQVRPGQRLASVYSPELVNAQKELLEAAKSKGTFPELYQAAREKLSLWKLSEEQIQQIENSENLLTEFDIRADQGGIVTQRNIAVGDYVTTGTVLFNVVDLSRVWVLIDAYESDLSSVALGNSISFTAAGIPGETFTAKVTYIDPVINPQTRAASIRAEVNNPGGKLKPEMFVNASITTASRAGDTAISIPRTSLLWSGKRSVVYVKIQDAEVPTFEMREITIGSKSGDDYSVQSGLEAGEEIVTNGVFAIDAAAQLSGKPSMMNRSNSMSMESSEEFQSQLTQLADEYFNVKNALVKDDSQAAKQSLSGMKTALGKVDRSELSPDAADHWTEMRDQIQKSISAMEKDSKLESLRKNFALLSEGVLEMTESFGLLKDKVYKDYCPMAFDNEGAYWLSENEQILNPYFGASMLTCGEIKTTYRKGLPVMESNSASNPSQHQH